MTFWTRIPAVRSGDELPRSERYADSLRNRFGSWGFIVAQTIFVTGWILANLYFLGRPFDAFPFILLNLAFSTQAAYAAPIILLSQKRSDKVASEIALADLKSDQRTEARIEELHAKVDALTAALATTH
jgi:uncharacterized membrane protein